MWFLIIFSLLFVVVRFGVSSSLSNFGSCPLIFCQPNHNTQHTEFNELMCKYFGSNFGPGGLAYLKSLKCYGDEIYADSSGGEHVDFVRKAIKKELEHVLSRYNPTAANTLKSLSIFEKSKKSRDFKNARFRIHRLMRLLRLFRDRTPLNIAVNKVDYILAVRFEGGDRHKQDTLLGQIRQLLDVPPFLYEKALMLIERFAFSSYEDTINALKLASLFLRSYIAYCAVRSGNILDTYACKYMGIFPKFLDTIDNVQDGLTRLQLLYWSTDDKPALVQRGPMGNILNTEFANFDKFIGSKCFVPKDVLNKLHQVVERIIQIILSPKYTGYTKHVTLVDSQSTDCSRTGAKIYLSDGLLQKLNKIICSYKARWCNTPADIAILKGDLDNALEAP